MMLTIVKRPVRVFVCHYLCTAIDCSPVGSEWSDQALSPECAGDLGKTKTTTAFHCCLPGTVALRLSAGSPI
jgi:hypothetical protein